MNTLFHIVFIIVCIVAGVTDSLHAQEGVRTKIRDNFPAVHSKTPVFQIPTTTVDSPISSSLTNPPQYRIIDSLFNAYSYLGTTQKPLAWHSGTNTLVTVMRGAFPSIGVSPDNIKDCSDALKIRTSYDGGVSWNDPIYVYADVSANGSGRPRYPSIDVIAPNGAITEKQNLHFAYYATLQSAVDTSASILAKKNHIFATQKNVTQIDPFAPFQGISIGTPTYYCGDESAISITKLPGGDDKNFIMLAANGYRDVNVNTSVLTDRSPILAMRYDWENELSPRYQTPLEWGSDKFAPISSLVANDASSRTSSLVGMDNDGNNFYCGVFGAFTQTSGPDTVFRFGFSKSSDNGATWSEYVVMPMSVLAAYEQANSIPAGKALFVGNWIANTPSQHSVASVRDMVVYGEDKLSFIAQLSSRDENSTIAHVVEVNYSSGQWSIRKIADTFAPERLEFMNMFLSSRLPDDINEDSVYIMAGNPRGGEHQIVKTADATTLLVKYLEPRAFVFKFGTGRVNSNNEVIIPDTVYTTDIVMATRNVAATSWGQVKNVTNNVMMERGTWIPKVIPNDLGVIPLLTVQTADKTGNVYDANVGNQYRLGTLKGKDFDKFKQYITTSSINFGSADPYSQFVVNVEEQSVALSDLSVHPNPASDVATIRYTSKPNTQTEFSVVTLQGESVQQTVLQNSDSGTMYYSFSTAQLPVGQYYCKINRAGTVSVIPMSVIR